MSKVSKILDATGLTSKMGREGFDDVIKRYKSSGRTLDIGSGGNPYEEYFPNRVSVDIEDHGDVDIISDVHDLSQIKDEEFDVVLCTEALEHFYNPNKAIEELTRVLKKDGMIILSTRFIFPLHNTPHDYYRFTEYGLKYLFRDYEILELKSAGGTMQTLGTIYQRIGFQCDTLWFKPFKIFWYLLSKITPLFSFIITKEYGDVTHAEKVESIMTSGYIVVAKKKE